MTQTEAAILQTLNELDAAAKSMSGAQIKPNLLPLFERLESLAQQLPRELNPELHHYLSRKSYEKARLLLQGRDAENARGTCG